MPNSLQPNYLKPFLYAAAVPEANMIQGAALAKTIVVLNET